VTQLVDQNGALADENNHLRTTLRKWEVAYGPDAPPPPDLRGKVIAVDPKWGFVVLNLGQPEEVRPTWTFLVSRDHKLIGKVRITSVVNDRSIANVLPGWQLDELREGDVVIPAAPEVTRAAL
jgi:hypothetical protein